MLYCIILYHTTVPYHLFLKRSTGPVLGAHRNFLYRDPGSLQELPRHCLGRPQPTLGAGPPHLPHARLPRGRAKRGAGDQLRRGGSMDHSRGDRVLYDLRSILEFRGFGSFRLSRLEINFDGEESPGGLK